MGYELHVIRYWCRVSDKLSRITELAIWIPKTPGTNVELLDIVSALCLSIFMMGYLVSHEIRSPVGH